MVPVLFSGILSPYLSCGCHVTDHSEKLLSHKSDLIGGPHGGHRRVRNPQTARCTNLGYILPISEMNIQVRQPLRSAPVQKLFRRWACSGVIGTRPPEAGIAQAKRLDRITQRRPTACPATAPAPPSSQPTSLTTPESRLQQVSAGGIHSRSRRKLTPWIEAPALFCRGGIR
jgi:hypothetical protein